MAVKRRKYPAGLTFVEIMIASAILIIAVLGASVFRYDSALSARKADLQATAARAALLLCESWRGASEPNSFDPTQLVSSDLGSLLTIESDSIMHELPEGFTLSGVYRIVANGTDYYAILSWRDVAPELRALNVAVLWDQRGSGLDSYRYPDKSFRLTTYVDN